MAKKEKSKQIFASTVERLGRKTVFSASLGKIGGTAGFTVRAANNTDLATCAASQTAAKFVLPLSGLKVGDKITAFHLIGQIESAGGAVTVDVDLRKMTAAAADPVDASISTMTQLSVTADTAMDSSNTSKTLATPEVVAADSSYYLLITATTAGSTDIALQAGAITVTEQ